MLPPLAIAVFIMVGLFVLLIAVLIIDHFLSKIDTITAYHDNKIIFITGWIVLFLISILSVIVTAILTLKYKKEQ